MNFTNEEVQDLRNDRHSQVIVSALFPDSVPEIDSHLEKKFSHRPPSSKPRSQYVNAIVI